MNRQEKIEAITDVLDENHIKIIEIKNIGQIIVEADISLDNIENEYEYNELLEKGLTEDEIEDFNEFLESSCLLMINTDRVSGVSFENVEYDGLEDSELWKDEEE